MYKCLVTVLVVLGASAAYGSPGEYPLIPGTVALWHMNEGSGSTIADASGNNHYASFNGTPHWPNWSAGLHGGGGIHLNQDRLVSSDKGTGAGAVINGGNLLDLETFTLQMHFKWDGGSGFVTAGDNIAGWLYRDYYAVEIRAHAYANNQQYYLKFLNNLNTGWDDLTYHETTVPPSDLGSGRLDADTWYELTFIREKLGNGTTDVSMWIDGTERVSHNFAGIPWGGSGAGFGHVNSGSSNFTIPGELDEARVLNFAIPEPATMCLLALGGLVLRRRLA